MRFERKAVLAALRRQVEQGRATAWWLVWRTVGAPT